MTIEGALDQECWFVFDFVVLKKIMKRLCDEIDHKVLLPLENPKVQIGEQGESVTVSGLISLRITASTASRMATA